MDDPFIRQYVEDLLTKIRTQVSQDARLRRSLQRELCEQALHKPGTAQLGITKEQSAPATDTHEAT
jgi:hypothetical protein